MFGKFLPALGREEECAKMQNPKSKMQCKCPIHSVSLVVGQQSVAVAALAVSISRILLHFLCTRNTFHGGTSGTFVIRAVSPSCFGKVFAFAFDIVVVVVVVVGFEVVLVVATNTTDD